MVQVGDRVELVRCSDPYTRLRPGMQGTVEFVDGIGTVFIAWDDGSSLGLIPGEDVFEMVRQAVEEELSDG